MIELQRRSQFQCMESEKSSEMRLQEHSHLLWQAWPSSTATESNLSQAPSSSGTSKKQTTWPTPSSPLVCGGHEENEALKPAGHSGPLQMSSLHRVACRPGVTRPVTDQVEVTDPRSLPTTRPPTRSSPMAIKIFNFRPTPVQGPDCLFTSPESQSKHTIYYEQRLIDLGMFAYTFDLMSSQILVWLVLSGTKQYCHVQQLSLVRVLLSGTKPTKEDCQDQKLSLPWPVLRGTKQYSCVQYLS